MLIDASLTNSFVNLATNVINDLGLAGIALLNVMSAVIGIPGTEVTMLFAGFNVYLGNQSLAGVIIAGVFGDLLGATIAYAIGYYGLHELLERRAGPLHVSPKGLQRAHAWFERYGPPVIAVSRLIPLLRSVFPYAAGIAKMSYWRFIAWATVGSVIWIGGLAVIGKEVGSNWTSWRKHLEYVDYLAVAVAVGLIAWFIVRRIRGDKARQTVA